MGLFKKKKKKKKFWNKGCINITDFIQVGAGTYSKSFHDMNTLSDAPFKNILRVMHLV